MRRPLLLSGFMATGKSTVGRLVAEWCGRPFIDLDARIEEVAGQSVSAIFASRGETAFRLLEGEALARVLDEGAPVVVSLGGGALLQRGTRLDALDRAVVVTLDATAAEVLRRTAGDTTRPLLRTEDPAAR